MNFPQVYMFVYNEFRPDVRVLKEAISLKNNGYKVTVIALQVNQYPSYETNQDIEIIRVPKLPFHYQILKQLRLIKKKTKRITKKQLNKIKLKYKNLKRINKKIIKLIQRIIFYNQNNQKITKTRIWKQWLKSYLKGIKANFISFNDYLYKAFFSKIISFLGFIVVVIYQWLNTFISNLLDNVLFYLHKPLCFFDYYRRAYAVIQPNSNTIYHAHDFNTLPIAWFCRRKFAGKLVYDSHELYTEMNGLPKLESWWSSILEKILIQKCDRVITVCNAIGEELQQRYQIEKPIVLLNCPQQIKFPKTTNYIRDYLHLDSKTPIILYQGGFSTNRGLPNLISASKHFKHGKLVLLGWGKIEEELKQLVAESNLEEIVYFLPAVPQEELLEWTGSANLGIIPYQAVTLNNYYTCPNKLFEYIQAGIPIAGSAFPEITNILNTYNIGVTFDPENPLAIAEAVNTILNNSYQYEIMCKNLVQARQILNWQNQEKKLVQIYSDL